ncbi:MAG: leucine-rich repeat domain-containing protein [Clostridiaceae bacterium]|jgi:hypothetical protein|nr:leucine-rich repeat domain-containing protein [Clostridiaceae bacterium]
MNYHYIVTVAPVFSEESVKYAVVEQNLTWLEKEELTRIEYIESAEPGGDRSNYMFILTGMPVSAQVYPLKEFLREFIVSLEADSNVPDPLDMIIDPRPITPDEVQQYYSSLKGQTNHEFFEDYYKIDDEKHLKILCEKIRILYYDLHLDYLLDDEMKSIYKGYISDTEAACEFTEEEKQNMDIARVIARMAVGEDFAVIPMPETDRKKIYYGRYHVSCGFRKVILPSYVNALDMPTVIKDRAFAGCDTVREVIIYDLIGKRDENDLVTDDSSFGEGAFFACSSLEKVYFNDYFTYIPRNAFEDCESLKEVIVPSVLREIGDFAFYGCTSLKNPDLFKHTNLQKIGCCAFCGCGFATLNLPDTLMVIEEKAFSGSMIQTIIIPDSVYLVGQGAFQSCKKLKSVKFCGILYEVPVSCFGDCHELAHIDLPNGLKRINDRAFDSCMNLKTIYIPDGVEEIGSDVFNNCCSLESIRFPGSVTSLGHCSFDKNLKIICRENSYVHNRSVEENWNYELE